MASFQACDSLPKKQCIKQLIQTIAYSRHYSYMVLANYITIASTPMFLHASAAFPTKSSDMLNKNTLGVKKVRGQSEALSMQHCKQIAIGATKTFDIS